MMKKYLPRVGALLLAVVMVGLSGCVTFTPVADVARDKPAYLAANFTLDQIPNDIKSKLPAAGSHPLPFQKLVMTGIANGIIGSAGTNTTKSDFKLTLINVNNSGVVQKLIDLTNDGVPRSSGFALSYLDLFPLKEQTAAYTMAVAAQPITIHSVDNTQWLIERPVEDATLAATFTYGFPIQVVNFKDHVVTCKTAKYYPASQVLASLHGQAIDIECTHTVDGLLRDKSNFSYLTEYGIVIQRSSTSAYATFNWTYTSFTKDD